MKRTGRPRRVTAAQLRVIRAWKPLREVAASVGLSYKVANWARNYHFKQPSP